MNILLLGDFSSDYDEGMKNIPKNFFNSISKRETVEAINVKKLLSKKSLDILLSYHPEVIHYFSSPTLGAFVILKLLKFRWPYAKGIISALHPNYATVLNMKSLQLLVKRYLQPEKLLYQVNPEIFGKICDNIMFFPNGVNTKKFFPVDQDEKMRLRDKYGLERDKFIILHVGHLSRIRNLQFFQNIQSHKDNIQVVIVGGIYVYHDKTLLEELAQNGCRVIVGYQENIEEIFSLADCYVFPVMWKNTINMPLTILEAMAVELPVITLEQPSMESFKEDSGFYIEKDLQDVQKRIYGLVSTETLRKSRNREKVLHLDWDILAEKLIAIYRT